MKKKRCPTCRQIMGGSEGSSFRHPLKKCPYEGNPYAELCSLHDGLYFGKWRTMDASVFDVKRGHRQVDQFLKKVKDRAWRTGLQPAKYNVKKAFDRFFLARPDEDPFASVRVLDNALSFAHHAINDLLHEEGLKPHNPIDYERYYDVTEIPFREEL